jgi:hypothetical protein
MLPATAPVLHLLHRDIINLIIENSAPVDVVALACASRQLNIFANEYAQQLPLEGRFGRAEWLRCGVETGEEPPISLLRMRLEFASGNCMLTLIPDQLTMNELDKHALAYRKALNPSDTTRSNYQYPLADVGITDETAKKSGLHWVTVSRDVLPGTRKEPFAEQEHIVKEHKYNEMPTLIAVAASILLHNIRNPEDLVYTASSGGRQWTYTRVQERNSNGFRIIAGGFSASGLRVLVYDYDNDNFGAAGVRKSFGS